MIALKRTWTIIGVKDIAALDRKGIRLDYLRHKPQLKRDPLGCAPCADSEPEE
jgi:hypothetical protein